MSPTDLVHLFETKRSALERALKVLRKRFPLMRSFGSLGRRSPRRSPRISPRTPSAKWLCRSASWTSRFAPSPMSGPDSSSLSVRNCAAKRRKASGWPPHPTRKYCQPELRAMRGLLGRGLLVTYESGMDSRVMFQLLQALVGVVCTSRCLDCDSAKLHFRFDVGITRRFARC